ncbi:MAG: N-acetylmuramic acid 6-phosphate etherase [Syntrophorhabdaceae bacterium PtaU1.Bin034]|jgi:N-acetylmuramic acid 6-phosphate etherase|nr:MAG: N-acetylmuramic acid 6-phosphate etherase [Syntrophorhabdaceae bacterium PtaU1.Bin034]
MKDIRAVIFDLDGTLVDSAQDISNAFNHALKPWGMTISVNEARQLTGGGVTELIEKMPLKVGTIPDNEALIRRFFEFYAEHLADNTRPYPQVVETLERLRGYDKVVISRKSESFCIRLLTKLGLLEHFKLVIGGNTVPNPKPSPDPVFYVLFRLDISAEEALMVGDGLADIMAGKAAGVRTVGAAYGYGSRGLWKNADFIIRSPSQLLDVLRLIRERTASTEQWNPASFGIDAMPPESVVCLMSEENSGVVRAIANAHASIVAAADAATAVLRSGGSLIFIGSGSNGLLGVLEAAEIRRMSGLAPEHVRAVVAGMRGGITDPGEIAGDDQEAGREAIKRVAPSDMCLGISASGTTPFVLAALQEARERGAKSWLLTCSEAAQAFLDGVIKVPVGPELIAGSTWFKSGTATKTVLNMISGLTMIRLGGVYDGYMVDLKPSDAKLAKRAAGIIQSITHCSGEEAERLLAESGGNPKIAVVMHDKNISRDEARKLLEEANGSLRAVLNKHKH